MCNHRRPRAARPKNTASRGRRAELHADGLTIAASLKKPPRLRFITRGSGFWSPQPVGDRLFRRQTPRARETVGTCALLDGCEPWRTNYGTGYDDERR
jgi:hypothetical protein